MLKPKDIGDKKVPSSAPLIKFGDGDEHGRGLLIAVLVSVFVVVALYVSGILFKNSALTFLAFVAAVVAILVIVWTRRSSRPERAQLAAKEINDEVERYKQDLVDTYIGYDVDYSVEDVLAAADEYRETLEIEKASVFDLDPSTLVKVVGESLRPTKEESAADVEESAR